MSEEKKRFGLILSPNKLYKYIDDTKMELSDRHGQIMGFRVEEDHEENVELLIDFLNKIWEEHQGMKKGLKEIREAYWALQYENRDFGDTVDPIIDKYVK